MKTISSLKFLQLFLFTALLFTAVACSDDEVQPDPEGDGDPMDDPMDTVEISENPVLRINTGGDEIGYGDIVFTKDTLFIGQSTSNENLEIEDILDTDMDTLYISERISELDQGDFEYKIPITNGTYNVKLHFAEIYWGAPNAQNAAGGDDLRVFDVTIEGEVKLEDFDIFKEVGTMTAVVKTYEVTVEDEELNIIFAASQDRPKLSALEVLGDGELIDTGGN